MSTVEIPQTVRRPPSRSASGTKPKGILKNAPGSGNPQHLQWDEDNLALTELQKDSQMKITEPKTPYVRYNPLTDEVEGDIPSLDLGGHFSNPNSPIQPQSPVSTTGADASAPSSRRTSFSSTGRSSSVPGRSSSRSSSRSTSFNLPSEAKGDIRAYRPAEPRNEEEVEEEEEELDEESAAKHAAFVRARGRHYSNEAEAMKMARALIEEEDDSSSALDKDSGIDVSMENESPAKVNGVTHAN